jgi:hypothetical protein
MRLTCERAYTCTVPYDRAFSGFIFAPGHSGTRPDTVPQTELIGFRLTRDLRVYAAACTVPYNTFLEKLASDRKQAYKRCAARIDPLGADD